MVEDNMITIINIVAVLALFAGIGLVIGGNLQSGIVTITFSLLMMAIGRVLENLRDLVNHQESAYKELNTIRQDLQNEILERRAKDEQN